MNFVVLTASSRVRIVVVVVFWPGLPCFLIEKQSGGGAYEGVMKKKENERKDGWVSFFSPIISEKRKKKEQ